MFLSQRSTPNNWFSKRISKQSTFTIPLTNVYTKTGTNHYARKVKYMKEDCNPIISEENQYFNIKF